MRTAFWLVAGVVLFPWYDEAGHPLLYQSPNSALSVCPPGGACVPLDTVTPGETAPGTRFKVTFKDDIWVTPPWRGRLTVTPPALVGEPHLGTAVYVEPGRWSGGWDVIPDNGRLYNCATAQGTGCFEIPAGTVL